jgi:hypothetical protein
MTKKNEAALTRSVAVIREVMQELAGGIDKATFEQKYRGKFVSPGVTVQQYIRQLRLSGDLDENSSILKLKPANNLVAA